MSNTGATRLGTVTESRASGPRAGFWRRFFAGIVDALVLAVPGFLLGLLGFDGFDIGTQVTLAVVTLIYHAYLEGGASGQTLGKRALGIRVMDFETGGALGFGRAAVRHLGRGVSGIVLGIGYLWMLWDRERRTWHDKLGDAVVVPVEDYPVGTPVGGTGIEPVTSSV